MCWIEQPTDDYRTGYEEPFYIDISNTSVRTLTIELSEYALTDDAECGSLVYDAFMDGGGFDPFDEANPIATISVNNVLTFGSLSEYIVGMMMITV